MAVDTVLPPELATSKMLLRGWRLEDINEMSALVQANLDHLRPFMPWVASEPLPLPDRAALIDSWETARLGGGDAVYGMFVDGEPVGGCGLHRRIGQSGLEIGYWVSAHRARRGVATAAARNLTTAAFAVPGVDVVEIHHDRANVASAGVPRRLAFALVAEQRRDRQAPGEVGIEWVWRMHRSRWASDAIVPRGG